jgi:glycosyltransferase involved in cell wall biosynthesis
MKIAFVVQRYGADVAGGSEALCRQVAERLSQFYEIEVLTSCAKDYITWRNEYNEGTETIGGVLVRRFKVDKERNLKKFTLFTQKVFSEPHTEIDELRWIEEQGPYVPKLLNFLKNHKDNYDLFVFFTYRYYPSFFGLPFVCEKSILVPTAEDEPTLNMTINKSFFCLPKAIIYLTEEEKNILMQRFNTQKKLHAVIGMGITLPENVDGERFKRKYKLRHDFIVYVGRIDENKGCYQLFDYFTKYKHDNPSNLKLVLIGKTVMEIPKNPDIIYLGFLHEQDKFAGIRASKFLVMPSDFESYSIVVTEAWALGTPILVNGRCAVLKGHCQRSNAGLYYTDYNEFVECINLLLSNNELITKLGRRGRAYVEANYNWDRIEKKYQTLFKYIVSDDIVNYNG